MRTVGSFRKKEEGRKKTEDGGRRTEGGGRRTEDGGRRTEFVVYWWGFLWDGVVGIGSVLGVGIGGLGGGAIVVRIGRWRGGGKV
jgi:hypothetical protein